MKILIVYNPNSGNGKFKKKINYFKSRLQQHNLTDYTFYESSGPNDITSYIKDVCSKTSYDVVVISGGDGTLNESINGLMSLESKPKIAYIPSGTANDVGYMLGMKKNIKKSIKIILQQNIVKIDIAKMNERHFIYTCGCGKFTKVSHSNTSKIRKKLFGKLYYFFEAAKEIIVTTEMKISIRNKTEEQVKGVYFLMLGLTGNRVGGFNFKRKIHPKLNDGKLDIILFDQKNFTSILNMTNYVLIGDAYKNGVKKLQGDYFEILSEEPLNFNVDGESYGITNRVELSIDKEALEIYVSKKSKQKYF